MSLSVMVSTDNQTILWVSAAFLEHAGCAASDIVGCSILDVVDGQTEQLESVLFAEDRRSHPCDGLEMTITPRAGAAGRYRLRHVRFIDGDDQTIAYVGLRAVTQPGDGEPSTGNAICDLVPSPSNTDAVITTDADARINGWNTNAAMLYGWLFEEVRGRRIGEVLGAPDPRIELRGAGDGGTERISVWNGPVRHRHRDGRVLTVESESTVIRDADGWVEGLLVIGRACHESTPNQYDERTGLVGRSTVLAHSPPRTPTSCRWCCWSTSTTSAS